MNEPKNIVRINTEELYDFLEYMPNTRNLLLLGPHGVGKSQIVTAYYESKGYKVIPLFLGQMSDAGDLLGLPDKKDIVLQNGEPSKKTTFLAPEWWDEEKPFCLFLDEINRGRPEILNAVMDLTLNKKLGGRKLPEGSVVVAAGNIGDGYTIQDLDRALLDRFAPTIFKPTVDEWLNFASMKGLDERVIDFISAENEWLDGDQIELEDPMDVTPSRRSWEAVSETISKFPGAVTNPVVRKMIASFVGPQATNRFVTYLSSRKTVDMKDLLEGDFEKVKKQIEGLPLQEIVQVNNQIIRFLENKFSKEEKDKIAGNFSQYLNFLKETKQGEALGQMMTYFVKHANWIVVDKRIHSFASEYSDESILN